MSITGRNFYAVRTKLYIGNWVCCH